MNRSVAGAFLRIAIIAFVLLPPIIGVVMVRLSPRPAPVEVVVPPPDALPPESAQPYASDCNGSDGRNIRDKSVLAKSIENCTTRIAREQGPALALDLTNRATAYWENNQLDRALLDLNQAIATDPELTNAYILRGQIESGLHDYDRALADLDKAIGLVPDNAWAYNNRGVAHVGKGQADPALADFD